MSLKGASVPIGATYAPTGGTAAVFASLGSTLNKHTLYLDEGLDLIMRRMIEVQSKPPVPSVNAPGGYTQQRTIAIFKSPILLANGNVTVNTAKLEIAFDPESNAAERGLLREIFSHFGVGADFDNLWDDGAVE